VVVEPAKLETLLSASKECPGLKYIVKMGSLTPEEKQAAKGTNASLMYFKGVEALGKDTRKLPSPPKPEDVMIYCYTSGTTGDPKGVILTHENVSSDVAGVFSTFPNDFKVTSDDSYLSFLPLAHVFEQAVFAALLTAGARIGFYRGDVLKMLDDVALLKPTMFCGVPRLLNRVYSKILSTVNEGTPLRKFLFNTALEHKKKLLRQGIVTKESFWDKLVLRKVQSRLGGNVRIMITGAAPIAAEVLEFLRAAFGCEVLEGYGQTETAAGACVTNFGDYSTEAGGHVGAVVPCTELKLVDIPDMNYFATDKPNPRGEICFRGNNVFKGYFKLPDKTKEALDQDGWCHTGDVGMILPNGSLKIIDRKKHLFKLSQGEYIAPEKIEQVYQRAPFVQQVFVHGESLRSTLVGVVVPDPDTLRSWAKQNGKSTDVHQLCKDAEVNKMILQGMIATGKENKLHSFEQVKAIYLEADPFTPENGLLTPSMKAKREVIRVHYKPQIEAMYKVVEP
jgi:long-chain acyl-CoA synthetase